MKTYKNIFSALMYEKTTGSIMEFVLWCSTLVVVVLSLVATILGKGNLTWVMMMLFGIGLAVMLAFRLKAISMLYNVCAFSVLTVMIHGIYALMWAGNNGKISVINIVFFILIMCLSVAVCVFQFIQAFSKRDFGNILTILVLVHSGFTILMQILFYALPNSDEYFSDWTRGTMNYRGYWIGTVTVWIMLVIVCLLHVFSFWGSMNSNRGKIHAAGSTVGVRGISGFLAGKTIPMTPGNSYLIGSDNQASIRISFDQRVSARHCMVQFNARENRYLVCDDSTNGTCFSNGQRLQRGQWYYAARGSVLLIGSREQQIKLL